MPNWLYRYFGDTIAPLIHNKDGRSYQRPPTFADTSTPYAPSSFWVRPPEPVVSLSRHIFDPLILYRPRVFLWLPHFFVTVLHCPRCITGVLEKNGAVAPRRIVDDDGCYYIVTCDTIVAKGANPHFVAGTSSS